MSTLGNAGVETYLFVAKWAPLSYMIAKEMPADSVVKIIDVEVDPVLADMNEVYSIPTFLVKKGEDEIFRVFGSFSLADLSRYITTRGSADNA